MPYVTVRCPENDCDVPVEFSIYGRYLHATLTDPPEYPEVETQVPQACPNPDCKYQFTAEEYAKLRTEANDAAEHYDTSDDYDDYCDEGVWGYNRDEDRG